MTIPSKVLKARAKRKKPNLNQKLGIDVWDLAMAFFQDNSDLMPTNLSNSFNGALRSRDLLAIRRLVSEFESPQLYCDSLTYATVAQLFAFFTKCRFPTNGGDSARRDEALNKFRLSERVSRRVTRKLNHYRDNPDRENPRMRLLLARARCLVDQVLGSVDNGLKHLLSAGRFGPGMTICSIDSFRTTPYYKIGQPNWTVTAEARPYFSYACAHIPTWVERFGKVDIARKQVAFEWDVVKSCRLTFVPKDERSFRTIAIEPAGNVYLQLGLHDYIAHRLRLKTGIDISDQSRNQRQASQGSKHGWGLVSTIDLSSASDSVSVGLINRLVRPQWIALLDDLRSKFYLIDGVEMQFEKWSSMGNGYTFSLETLLFWALAQASEDICATGRQVAVYGDDILPSSTASLLTCELLRYCGFTVNTKKSHIVGPFRESCGADFFNGVSVRPVFVKNNDVHPTDAYRILNTLCARPEFETSRLARILTWELGPSILLGPKSADTTSHCHITDEEFRVLGKRWRGWNKHFQKATYKRLIFRSTKFPAEDKLAYFVWLYVYRDRIPHTDTLGFWYVDPCFELTQRGRGVYRLSNTCV